MSKERTKQPRKSGPQENWIYGHHAVEAAIRAGRRPVKEICVTHTPTGPWQKLLKGLKLTVLTKAEMAERFGDAVHQGMAARVGELPPVALADVTDATLLLMLDQVTDPHNLGAILRSADAFGCGGVIVPPARSAALTEVVAKTACGALETVPVIETNLAQAIQKLQQEGFWVIGLDGAAETVLADVPKYAKTCLVMGSEGAGLRDLVAKHCDHLAKLPMVGTVESLNVSVATGIALYELSRVIG